MSSEIEILFQDSELLVINKPAGMLSVPGRGPEKADCAVSRMKALFPAIPEYPAVHRLDMATSGILVFAFTKETHRELSMAMETRLFQKEYTAVLEGQLPPEKGKSGRIELSFRLDPENRPRQIYDPQQGKLGITLWEEINHTAAASRILFRPLTGRTHQLRVHAAHSLGLKTPIAGDTLYGSGQESAKRLMLHASWIKIPRRGKADLEIRCPAPF